MSEFGNWLASNWYEAGTLLLHAALLVTVIWYVRKNVSLKMASLHQSDPERRETLTLGEADLGAAIRAETSSKPKGPDPLCGHNHPHSNAMGAVRYVG